MSTILTSPDSDTRNVNCGTRSKIHQYEKTQPTTAKYMADLPALKVAKTKPLNRLNLCLYTKEVTAPPSLSTSEPGGLSINHQHAIWMHMA
jgi:hypothetical protein